jgi:polyisoprenoid-binding protein YceI
MRPVLACAVALAATLFASRGQGAGDSFAIDPARTAIRFEVQSPVWGVTKGRFARFEGRLNVDFARPARSSVAFDVDAASVDTGSAGLDDYIRSALLFASPVSPGCGSSPRRSRSSTSARPA